MDEYSIWLAPSAEAEAEFADIIAALARRYGGPVFSPHVTLFGDSTRSERELLVAVEALVESLEAGCCQVESIDVEDRYFRSIYARLRADPWLMNLHRAVAGLLDETPRAFLPHLSLAYGYFPIERKRRMIEEVRKRIPDRFQPVAIDVARTGPDVGGWQRVARIPIPGGGDPD